MRLIDTLEGARLPRFPFHHAPLRVALIAQVVLPVLLAVAGIFYGAVLTAEALIERRMEEDIELVARALRMPVGGTLESGQDARVEQVLEAVFEIDRVYGAYVYDARGRRIVAVGAVPPDTRRTEVRRLVNVGGTGTYEQVDGEPVYTYSVPLMDSARNVNGLLQVTRRGSDFTRYMTDLRQQAVTALIVLLVVIVGLLLVAHHVAIGRPLRLLVEAMARVERGDARHRAVPTGPREVATLGVALNRMLDSLQRADSELRQRQGAEVRLQRQLKETEKMAAVGQVATGVAHELGAPLSVIDGKARRLAQRPDLSARSSQELAGIRAEVRRMGAIVRQLLDFGRSRSGVQRPVSAARACRAAVASVEPERAAHRVRLEYSSPADPGLRLRGDPLRLEQALVNLLRNAIQAAEDGRVELGAYCEDEVVRLRVDDSGPGVSAALRERVFEPFYTTKESGRGTGLGLCIVNNVAEEYGGHVTIAESPLGGARFELVLPLDAALSEQGA